jgi:hypothetical protein
MQAKRIFPRFIKSILLMLLLVGLVSAAVRGQGPAEPPPSIKPQELAAYDNFGAALAVSGDTLIVGAPGTELPGAHNGGAAYIFQHQGKDWKEAARLLPNPLQANTGFGYAVALDGGTAVVGARYEYNPDSGNGSGAAYVYIQRNGAWQFQARLAAIDGAPFDLFGDALALHGDWLAVGARAADGPNGERNVGAVYLFQRDGTNWKLRARLAPGDAVAEDHFGQALALDSQYLFVGAPGHDLSGVPNSGLVYGYRLREGSWVEEVRLSAEEPQPDAQLGTVLGLEGSTLIALAGQEYQKGVMPPSAPWYGGDFGAVHVFELQAGVWRWQTRLAPSSQDQDGVRLNGAALAGEASGLRLALSGMGMGTLYRYQKKGQAWEELPALKFEQGSLGMGEVVALSEDQVLQGHRFYDLNNGPNSLGEPLSSVGAVFVLDW